MKPQITKSNTRPLIVASALAIGLSLSSCVSPYDTTTTTSVRTYRPGYTVDRLPGNYRTEVISGTNYYYNDGAYYQRRNGRYVVVDAPRRSRYYDEYTRYGNKTVHHHRDGSSHVVSRLPKGYSTVQYRGEPYYRHRDRYYQRRGNGYVVVSNPFR